MTHDTSATEPRPSFAPPSPQPQTAPQSPDQAPRSPAGYGPPPGYGAPPSPCAPDQPNASALPAERVGRGAALALLAVPAGAVVSGVIWQLGFVASITSFLVAALAAVLYARGSGGRVAKGIPVIAGVILLGVVVSFFTAVAVDLYGYFPKLDPDVAATYPSRWSFVSENLFYPPLLKDYTKDAVLFVLFGLLGGLGTVLRLVRANRRR